MTPDGTETLTSLLFAIHPLTISGVSTSSLFSALSVHAGPAPSTPMLGPNRVSFLLGVLPEAAGACAGVLAQLVALTPAVGAAVADLGRLRGCSPPWVGWDHPGRQLWPVRDTPGPALEEHAGPAWVDAAGAAARPGEHTVDDPRTPDTDNRTTPFDRRRTTEDGQPHPADVAAENYPRPYTTVTPAAAGKQVATTTTVAAKTTTTRTLTR